MDQSIERLAATLVLCGSPARSASLLHGKLGLYYPWTLPSHLMQSEDKKRQAPRGSLHLWVSFNLSLSEWH